MVNNVSKNFITGELVALTINYEPNKEKYVIYLYLGIEKINQNYIGLNKFYTGINNNIITWDNNLLNYNKLSEEVAQSYKVDNKLLENNLLETYIL